MQFMTCTTCSRLVQLNNTGTCLGCQRGFTGMDAEDVWKPPVKDTQNIPEDTQNIRDIERLEERKKEIEASLAEPQTSEGGTDAAVSDSGARKKARRRTR